MDVGGGYQAVDQAKEEGGGGRRGGVIGRAIGWRKKVATIIVVCGEGRVWVNGGKRGLGGQRMPRAQDAEGRKRHQNI